MRLPKPYGPRGVAMLYLAGLAYGRAIVYSLPVTPEFTPEVLTQWTIPIWVWAALWLLAGVHLSVSAFQPKHALALAAIQSMSILWAIVFIISAFNRATVYGIAAAAEPIITASVFVCLVGIIYSLSRTVNLTNTEFEKRAP